MNEACNQTITHGKTTWENCCPNSTAETAPSSCPPILQNWSKCPTSYTNCADPSSHREMCAAELTGYSDSRSLNRKCCPTGYTCGSDYNMPCVLMGHNTTQDGGGQVQFRTNPQYLSAPAVFAGCNDASALSPAAVGGIVAVGVISFCLLCGALLWWIRRRLYRDPARRRYSKTGEQGAITAAGTGVVGGKGEGLGSGAGEAGITITREFKVEEKDGVKERAEGAEAGRRSGDSTTRILPDGARAGSSRGSGGDGRLSPPEGMFWAAGERERSEV